MSKCRAIVLLVLSGTAIGCRTVWMHPEATAQKYADDMFWCQHGYHRDERVAEHTEPKPLHRGWRECMGSLGWEARKGAKGSLPYERHETDAARTLRERAPMEAEKASEYDSATWVGEGARPAKASYYRDAALCRGESWDPDEIAQLGQLGRDTGLVLSKSTRIHYAACMAKKNWVYVVD